MKHCGVIDLPNCSITLRNKNITKKILKTSKCETFRVSQVFAASACTLPPFTRRIVKICKSPNDRGTYVTTPFQDRRMSAPSCVIPASSVSCLKIANLSRHHLTIEEGDVITSSTEVDRHQEEACTLTTAGSLATSEPAVAPR